MRYLFATACRAAKRSLKTTLLINLQFVFVFLFLTVLMGMVSQQNNNLKQIDQVIGENAWLVQPTLNDKNKVPSWNRQQVEWLEQKFPQKVGLLQADFSEMDHGKMTYAANSLLWDRISNHHDSSELRASDVDPDIMEIINPPGWRNAIEVFFLKRDSLTYPTQLSLYIFDVNDKEINLSELSAELSEMADGQPFQITRLIGAQRQSIVIESVYTKVILVFVILSSILILTSIMSFIMVRFLSQSRKLAIFHLYGATRRDLAIFVLFSNLMLIGPAFAASTVILILCSSFLPVAVASSLLGSFILFVFIAFILTLPVVHTNRSTLKINTI